MQKQRLSQCLVCVLSRYSPVAPMPISAWYVEDTRWGGVAMKQPEYDLFSGSVPVKWENISNSMNRVCSGEGRTAYACRWAPSSLVRVPEHTSLVTAAVMTTLRVHCHDRIDPAHPSPHFFVSLFHFGRYCPPCLVFRQWRRYCHRIRAVLWTPNPSLSLPIYTIPLLFSMFSLVQTRHPI